MQVCLERKRKSMLLHWKNRFKTFKTKLRDLERSVEVKNRILKYLLLIILMIFYLEATEPKWVNPIDIGLTHFDSEASIYYLIFKCLRLYSFVIIFNFQENSLLRDKLGRSETENSQLKKMNFIPSKKSATALFAVLFVFSLSTFGPIG